MLEPSSRPRCSGLSAEPSDAPVDAAGVNCRSRRRVCRVPDRAARRRRRGPDALAAVVRTRVHHRRAGAAAAAGEPSFAPRLGRSGAAPIVAPDHIEDPADEPPPVHGSDPLGDACTGLDVGLPEGLTLDTFTPPPLRSSCRLLRSLGTYRPGGDIREPRKIRDAPAVYPEIARAAKIEGVVILEATIDERGVVTDARVLRSVPLLDAAALTALKQWRYTPTLLNGVPVRVLMTVTFRFSLGDRDL